MDRAMIIELLDVLVDLAGEKKAASRIRALLTQALEAEPIANGPDPTPGKDGFYRRNHGRKCPLCDQTTINYGSYMNHHMSKHGDHPFLRLEQFKDLPLAY